MPTINKRFLLKLVLIVAALVGTLFGVHAVQADRIPEALRAQADRAAEAGKTDTAIHYLRQYLEFTPDDIDAQIRLVELIKKRSPGSRGQSDLIFLYDRILRIDPDRHEVRRDALTACLRHQRYNDALIHAEALLKVFPDEAALWQLLGAAQTGLNRLADARQSYENAITHEPNELVGYQRLAQLLWRNMDDPAAARTVLDRMVKAAPQSAAGHLVRARFETFLIDDARAGVRGDPKLAMAHLQRVLELDPENADASLALAELLQKDRKVPAAHAILRDAVSLYPRDLRLVRSLSWLELVRGNAPAAIAVLEDGLKARPDGFDLLIPLADLLVQQGDTARTAEILRRLETTKAPVVQVKYLKARVAMRDNRWKDAAGLLESLRAEVNNLPALETQLNLLLAVCAGKLADRAAEEKAYERILVADPKNVQARIGLGNLYLTLGRFDEAVRELEAATGSQYAPGPVVAQFVRTKAKRLHAASAPAHDWMRLEAAALGSVSRFGPVSSEPILLHAEVGLAAGKNAEVVKMLRKEAARRPGDSRLWAALADAVADHEGTAAGLAVIDEAQAACGDNAEIRLARARLHANEPGRIRPLASLADNIESWPEVEQIRLLFGMVELFDQVEDHAAVARTLRMLAGRLPTDIAVWLKLHERALRTGDAKSASDARAAIVKLEGDAGHTVLLCDAAAASPADAPKLLERMTAAFGPVPVRADACLALARLFSITGNEADAAAMTERAFALEPTRYDAARSLLLQRCAAGADDRTQQLVTRLATDPRWAGDPFRRLIASVVPKVQVPVAAKLLNWSRPHVERDPGGLGWLAATAAAYRILDPIPILEEAVAKKSASIDDWLRLALVRNPNDLNGVRGKPTVTPAAYFAAAAILAETPGGKDFVPVMDTPTEVRAFAQSRLSVKLSRNKPAEAAKELEGYLATKDITPTDAAWARRNLAMLYAIGGTPEDRKRAMELIKSVDDTGTSPYELRATANVLTTLARYLEGTDRVAVLTRAAVALNSAYKASNSAEDLYRLSQLYRAAGNRVESRNCLRVLLQADAKNMDYLVVALEELVENQEFTTGRGFADQLLAHHRGEFRAVAAVARYEAKAGRPEAALAVAEDYTRNADPAAGDHLTRAGRVAELLDELSRLPKVRHTSASRAMTDAAAERYAALVPNRAEAIVGVVGVLAADGRIDQAFARIEQFGRYLPARVRAAAGLAIMRAGGASERQATTVLEWLDGCLKEEPNSPALLMNRAEFLTLRQDLAGAAAEYEKVLVADPKNVVALNNLAWILAADPRTAERALELVARATREVGLSGDLLDTRARVRITLKQFVEAERDLNDAIRLEATGLRWFHLAVSRLGQTPPKTDDATKAFREARRRGLEQKGVHPADRATFDVLDAGMK